MNKPSLRNSTRSEFWNEKILGIATPKQLFAIGAIGAGIWWAAKHCLCLPVQAG